MGILMFLVILGTMVALMIRAGGSKAYGDWAVSHIKTKSGALWSTFILAIVLGVDDYFNNLTTGNVMRPVADGHHISRAKLSYMCDATAAPVCIMMMIRAIREPRGRASKAEVLAKAVMRSWPPFWKPT